MTIGMVRAQFRKVGLSLEDLRLEATGDGRRVIKATGHFVDGMPFVEVCAPFQGDPVERAFELASDLVRMHHGGDMAAPGKIGGVADALDDLLRQATARADAVVARAQNSKAKLDSVLDSADEVAKAIDDAAANIQAKLGLHGNGGPG